RSAPSAVPLARDLPLRGSSVLKPRNDKGSHSGGRGSCRAGIARGSAGASPSQPFGRSRTTAPGDSGFDRSTNSTNVSDECPIGLSTGGFRPGGGGPKSTREHEEDQFMTEIPREVAYLVCFVLIEAAMIDGRCLRVPNWLTVHFLAGGWIYAYVSGGGSLLLWSIAGAAVGLLSLLPLYAI